jgi:hypothetical protein
MYGSMHASKRMQTETYKFPEQDACIYIYIYLAMLGYHTAKRWNCVIVSASTAIEQQQVENSIKSNLF